MAVTKDELRDFTRFADQKLENGGVDTLSDLASEWESHRQGKKSSLENSAIPVDSDTIRELAKFFPDVQDERQLQEALARRGGATTAEMLGNAMLAAVRSGRE